MSENINQYRKICTKQKKTMKEKSIHNSAFIIHNSYGGSLSKKWVVICPPLSLAKLPPSNQNRLNFTNPTPTPKPFTINTFTSNPPPPTSPVNLTFTSNPPTLLPTPYNSTFTIQHSYAGHRTRSQRNFFK